jgi:ketosteroid isomerase-like protein
MNVLRGLVLFVACATTAENAIASEAPDSVLAADAAFAVLSLERGQQAAFQANLADDGVIFRPDAVNGREWLATHEQASGRLEWSPEAAAVACDGQLAVTTGPWSYLSPDGGDLAVGHYLSVWRREPDGRWRVVLDHGIGNAPNTGPPVDLRASLAALWPHVPAKNCRAARWSEALSEAERRLDDAIRSGGLAAALRRSAAPGALAYRDDAAPGPLAAVTRATDTGFPEGSEASPRQVHAEPGSNLGYSHGEIIARVGGSAPATRAVYVRIWQGDGRRWRLALDMTTVLPPAASQ